MSAKKTTPKSEATKKTTAKKATSKTTPRKKATSRSRKNSTYQQSAHEKKLVKQLIPLLERMDASGLAFLIEQATVHLYNMQVLALEATRCQARAESTQTIAQSSATVRIECSQDGQVYHIVHNRNYSMFNDQEMLQMVRIVHTTADLDQGTKRLYNWFVRERHDFITNNGLGDATDEAWYELTTLIKKNFTLQ